MKDTKEKWQLNAISDSWLDPGFKNNYKVYCWEGWIYLTGDCLSDNITVSMWLYILVY